MNILLISGHGAGDVGACSDYGIESNETRRFVSGLKTKLMKYNVNVDTYPTERNAYEDLKNGNLQVNFSNYDYILEVHFNSAGNDSANGTEIYVTTSENATTVEQAIVNKISSLGYRNRGVKREDFSVIYNARSRGVSAALLEVCFISNEDDMKRYNDNFDSICTLIADAIGEEFGLSLSGNVIPPTEQPKPVEKPTINYIVKTKDGKQLGAFNVLDNAKNMAKGNNAIVYNASGSVVVSYVPTVSSERRYAENGTYYFNVAVTVRTSPEENARTNVTYYAGESVIYHHVILNKNGFNWIEYARNDGSTGYLKVKDLATGESYGYAV